jgi:micrococcal nuclease
MMPVGSGIRLEEDARSTDRYGRILAYAWMDSLMINREMVRRGWALLYTVPPNVRHVDLLREAEDSARSDGAGHWSTDGFACAPARHRRKEC